MCRNTAREQVAELSGAMSMALFGFGRIIRERITLYYQAGGWEQAERLSDLSDLINRKIEKI